ncbi:hypothetical protein LAY57_30350, partial [Argonema antarcticum A004/B2]|nr:hypothetical protein [Argonema antarcticum A004/B2]
VTTNCKTLTACGFYSLLSPRQVKRFVEDMGLNLVLYKYLTSRDRREQISDFGKFARENLPCQTYMSPLFRQYFKLNFDLNYALDDYVILAKR